MVAPEELAAKSWRVRYDFNPLSWVAPWFVHQAAPYIAMIFVCCLWQSIFLQVRRRTPLDHCRRRFHHRLSVAACLPPPSSCERARRAVAGAPPPPARGGGDQL